MREEYAKLLARKRKAYAAYKQAREEMKELYNVKSNVEHLLNIDEREIKKKRYRLVSLYHPTEDGDGTAVVDKYGDDGHTVEDAVIREINLEILRRALKSLTDEELKIVRSLYLDDNPMSERQLSRIMNIPVTTLDYRKRQVLKKLRYFFEKN